MTTCSALDHCLTLWRRLVVVNGGCSWGRALNSCKSVRLCLQLYVMYSIYWCRFYSTSFPLIKRWFSWNVKLKRNFLKSWKLLIKNDPTTTVLLSPSESCPLGYDGWCLIYMYSISTSYIFDIGISDARRKNPPFNSWLFLPLTLWTVRAARLRVLAGNLSGFDRAESFFLSALWRPAAYRHQG